MNCELRILPAGKVDQEEDDADDEEDQHGSGQPHNLRVVLRWEVIFIPLEDLGDCTPELHRLERGLL